MRSLRISNFLIGAVLCVGLPSVAVAHGGAAIHNQDLALLLGGYNKSPLGDIARRISSAHDNEWPKWFRENVGPVPGNHRVLGHGAPLGANIPKDYLNAVQSRYGAEAVKKVVLKQRELSVRFRGEIMNRAGLNKNEARALMRRFSLSHLTGDVTPDNRLVDHVMKFSDQCKMDRDVAEVFFRKANPKYADMMQRKIDRILKMPKSEQAVAYQKMWAEVKFDDALKLACGERMEKAGCKYDINEAIRRNVLLKEKYASKNPYEKKPVVSKGEARVMSSWGSTFARAGFWSAFILLRDAAKGEVNGDTWVSMAKVSGREIGLEVAGRLVAKAIVERSAQEQFEKTGSRMLKRGASELAMKRGFQIVGAAAMIASAVYEAGGYVRRYNEGQVTMEEMNAQIAIIAASTGVAVFLTCTEKGAEIGTAVGTFIGGPGLGNAAGGLIGGALGVVAGLVGGAGSAAVSYYYGSKKVEWCDQKQTHYLEWTRDMNERQWNAGVESTRNAANQKIKDGWMILSQE